MWLSQHTNWRVFITTVVLIFTYLVFPLPTHAQTTSLSIWPPLFETTIKPGNTITQTYRLKNLGDDTTITAQIKPFKPEGELGHISLGNTPPPPYFSLVNTDLNQDLPTSFPLKAGQIQELQLKIAIPEDAVVKDHYLTFLFSSQTPGLIKGTGTTTQASIGSNILLTISQEKTKPTAKILEFRTSKFLDSFSPTSFTLKAKNPSPHYLKTIGQIEVKNTFNKSVTTLPLRQDNILTNSTRQLQTTSDWNPVFPFGRYQATATITPENSTNAITQTIYLWFLPYKLILIIIIFYIIKRFISPRLTN